MGGHLLKLALFGTGLTQRHIIRRIHEKEEVDPIRAQYGIPDDWNTLLFVGRLTWVKSVRPLLQAILLF
jgi:hypothetical protein